MCYINKEKKMKKFTGLFLLIIMLTVCLVIFSSCGLALKNLYNTINYVNESKYSVGNFEYQSSDIDEIEINWIFGDITIIESDNEVLSVSEDESGLKTNQQLRYLIEGRTLKIQFWKSKYRAKLSNHKKDLTIEIPKGIKLEIEQVSGNIKSDTLNLESLDIDIVSGNTRIDSLTSKEVNIDSVSGKINIKSINSDDIDIDTVSGDVNLGFASAKEVDIDCVSGDIVLSLNGMGATIEFNSVSGHYKNNKIIGDGSCEITVDTTSGDLKVEA